MSGEMSSRMRGLFDAAKQDGPSEASRDAMWAGIQMAVVTAPAPSGSAAPTAPASSPVGSAGAQLAAKAIASSKLALGIALGASITVGVAGAVILAMRPTAPPMTRVAEPRELDRAGQDLHLPATPVVITGHAAPSPTEVELDPVAKTPAPRALSERDRLAQEARMVSEARGALHRGEPENALRIVRAARAQRGARLVPEELTVEAQALRAMGDEAGAKRVEAELAAKFPAQELGQ